MAARDILTLKVRDRPLYIWLSPEGVVDLGKVYFVGIWRHNIVTKTMFVLALTCLYLFVIVNVDFDANKHHYIHDEYNTYMLALL